MLKDIKSVPLLEISQHERGISIELMRSIFEVQSFSGDTHDMRLFLLRFVTNLNNPEILMTNDSLGNVYITKGHAETYPCIVSHIDTVHELIPEEDYVVLNSDKEFFAIDLQTKSPTGIGGDDNNGIYTCLDNLIREDYIKIAFFVDEEIGCIGSGSCDMIFFEDVSFVLQADRKGYNDVVHNISGTKMFGIDFFDAIADDLDNYNRELKDGGMTDVMQLAHNGLNVAMANFSCGYYNPHSDREYVVIDELILTSLLFRDIIKSAYSNGLKNEFEREPYVDYYTSYGYGASGYGGSEFQGNTFDDMDMPPLGVPSVLSGRECSYCGGKTQYDESTGADYCFDCLDYDY